jgi:uncharacterized protein (TIGR02599 family)
MLRGIKRQGRSAFTILEVLVASVVLALILLVMLGVFDSVRNIHRRSMAQIKAFREGRQAVDVISTTLSQATLNSYLDYVDASGRYRFRAGGNADLFVPASYKRTSELRFRSGNLPEVSTGGRPAHAVFFQAPLGLVGSGSAYTGLENLINSLGFFIEFGDDTAERPDFFANLPNQPPPAYRYRLMQAIQPSETLTLYNDTAANPALKSSDPNGLRWLTDTLGSVQRVVAENIIALVVLPKLGAADQKQGGYSDGALAPNYLYDSTVGRSDPMLNPSSQLPPVIEITLVAVDEKSYARFQGNATTPRDLGLAPLFQTVGDTMNSANPGYARDLKTLADTLTQNNIDYRIFKVSVPIRSARWSRDQQD